MARWVLTIGALLWFPIVQPVLEIFLTDGWAAITGKAALLIVQLLGAAYLLKSAGFLAIWFLVLWLALRWNTQRRVQRLLRGWRSAGENDPTLNLASATVSWMDDLLDPIRQARERAETLAKRAEALKSGTRRTAA
jgi:hypothetical protein